MANPFATVSDLEKMLRRDLDLNGATEAVQAASDEIRGFLRQTISEATTTGKRFRPIREAIFLDELPVQTDTVEVEVDDEAFEDFDVEADTGILVRDDGDCWDQDSTIKVTYTHGYPDGDERLRTARRVCLYAAARIYTNPEQVMQKRRGDYSTGYGSSTVESSGLTTWERALLKSAYPHTKHRF